MRRAVIALLLLVSGAAATAAARPAKHNPAAQGHSAVGVISDPGGKLHLFKHSLFGGVERVTSGVPVESWHLDDLVVDRFRAAFGTRAVQRVPYRKELVVTWPLLWWRVADSTASLRRMVSGTPCTRYVVVSEGRDDDEGYVPNGFSVEKTSGFSRTLVLIHAIINVTVHDGETLKIKDIGLAHTAKGLGIAGIPVREVDESFWPTPPSSAAQNAKLRDAVRELVAQSMDATIARLKAARAL